MTELTITADSRIDFYITIDPGDGSRVRAVLRSRNGWWSIGKPFQPSIRIESSVKMHWTEALKCALALLEEPI